MQYFHLCGLLHHGIRNSNKYVAVSKKLMIQNSKLLSIRFCNAMIMIAGLWHLLNSLEFVYAIVSIQLWKKTKQMSMFSCNAGKISKERCHRHFSNGMNSVFTVYSVLKPDSRWLVPDGVLFLWRKPEQGGSGRELWKRWQSSSLQNSKRQSNPN